jgi:hypothetical protein
MFHVDLGLNIERGAGAQLITLRAGDGEARLRLLGSDHRGSFTGHLYGDAFLSAPDRVRGGAFVRTLAGWLHRSIRTPCANPGELRDFPCRYIRQVEPEGEHLRLDMGSWSSGASLLLYINPGATVCKLMTYAMQEKELRALTVALRDGWPPPRRTSDDDPLVSRSQPLVTELVPLPGSEHASRSASVWVGPGLLGLVERDDEHEVLYWPDLGSAPRAIWRFKGFPLSIEPSPDGRWAALTICHATREQTCTIEDATVVLVPIDPLVRDLIEVLPLARSEESFTLSPDAVRWSPAGDRVALRGQDRMSLLRPEVVRIYNPAKQGLESTHRLSARRSDPPGSVLPVWAVQPSRRFQGLGSGPRPSPDGRYLVGLDDGALVVTDRSGRRRNVVFTNDHDREALAKLEVDVSWLGGSAFLFDSDELFVLDLERLRLRYLLPPLPLSAFFWSASPDHRRVLVPRLGTTPGDGPCADLWGEVRW